MAEGVSIAGPAGIRTPPGMRASADAIAFRAATSPFPRDPEAMAAPDAHPYDPKESLAFHLHRHGYLLGPEQQAVLDARIPARGIPETFAVIANRLRIPQSSVQRHFDEAWDAIDGHTAFMAVLSPAMGALRRRAPVSLRDVRAMPWARGLHPDVMSNILASRWDLHVVKHPDIDDQVVPVPQIVFDDALKRLAEEATSALACRDPRSLTKGILPGVTGAEDARIAGARLLGLIYEGCDVIGIQVRLRLEAAAVANLFAGDATISLARASARLAAAMPAPPAEAALRAMLTRHADPCGDDAFARRPVPLTPTVRNAVLNVLEEQPYEITTREICKLVAERTGHKPPEASVDEALRDHGRLVRTDPMTWVGRARRSGPDPSPPPEPPPPPSGRDGAGPDMPPTPPGPSRDPGTTPARAAPSPKRRASRRRPAPARSAKASPATPAPTTPAAKAKPTAKATPAAAAAPPSRTASRFDWTTERDADAMTLWRKGASIDVIVEGIGHGVTPRMVRARLRALGGY